MPKCLILDHHIALTTNHTYRPCCKFPSDFLGYKYDEISLKDLKTTDKWNDIINTMHVKDKWHKGCIDCEKEENFGSISTREEFNEIISNMNIKSKNSLKSIEFNFSNQCNGGCIMCTPVFSSTWENIIEQQNMDAPQFNIPINQLPTKSKFNIKKFLENVDLTELEYIKYLGGEPFLMPETDELLDYLTLSNISKNVTLQITTNGSIFREKHIKQLLQFKKVFFTISVDDVNERYDYIRWPLKWSVLDKNIKKFLHYFDGVKNVKMLISTCLMIPSIYYLIELFECLKKYKYKDKSLLPGQLIPVLNPWYLCVTNLPDEEKSLLIQQFEYYVKSNKNDLTIQTCFNNLIYTLKSDQKIRPSKDLYYKLNENISSWDNYRGNFAKTFERVNLYG